MVLQSAEESVHEATSLDTKRVKYSVVVGFLCFWDQPISSTVFYTCYHKTCEAGLSALIY